MFDISNSTVRRYDKEVLRRDTPPPDLDNLRTLLVDEKSVGRGHNYLTIVVRRAKWGVSYRVKVPLL